MLSSSEMGLTLQTTASAILLEAGPDIATNCPGSSQCYPPRKWVCHCNELSVLASSEMGQTLPAMRQTLGTMLEPSSSEMGLTLQITVSAFLLGDGPHRNRI